MARLAGGSRLRVQVLSDIHGELAPSCVPSAADVGTDAEIAIVAGDMASAPDSVEMAGAMFPRAELIVAIGGNHEHYRTKMGIWDGLQAMRDSAAAFTARGGPRLVVLEDDETVEVVRGVPVRLLGCTLWSDYALYGDPVRDRLRVYNALNDFRLIQSQTASPMQVFLGGEPGTLTTSEVLSRHDASRLFLETALARQHDGPTIVVTHHLPSMRSVSRRYRDDRISAGFASRLDPVVALGATLWVHGHTHDSCTWRDAGGTLVVCNPAGYARSYGRENAKFDPRLVIDIRRGAPDGSWRAGRERKVPLPVALQGTP